jgi:hypothetical protein
MAAHPLPEAFLTATCYVRATRPSIVALETVLMSIKPVALVAEVEQLLLQQQPQQQLVVPHM